MTESGSRTRERFMAELKTQPNDRSVEEFLDQIQDEQKRRDAGELAGLMQQVTGEPPTMWGTSIVGFGTYRYRYPTGREADWFIIGFSPRKQSLTLYLMDGFERYGELMGALGKHSTGKSCLYVKRLDDVDLSVLQELIERSVAHVKVSDGKLAY